ncbi:MAG: polyprenol monophosphomannose synthase [Solirubrobacterales bacterium]
MDAHADTWVVIPTYNEAENIARLVAAALGHLPPSRRILVVDDSSPDGTGAIADRLAAKDPDVEVLHRTTKEGLGPAYKAGFARALAGGARRIVEMDADFSHNPAHLPALLAASEDADLVLGSRYVPGGGVRHWGPLRRVISRGGCLYARAVLGVPVADLTGGFKCFRRSVLESIDLGSVTARGYGFQVEMTYRAIQLGFTVSEIPIVFTEREYGRSKMSRGIVAEAAWRVPAMRFTARPSRPPKEMNPAA